jgi:hypothetical protein
MVSPQDVQHLAQVRTGGGFISSFALAHYDLKLALHPKCLAGSIFGTIGCKHPHLSDFVGAYRVDDAPDAMDLIS